MSKSLSCFKPCRFFWGKQKKTSHAVASAHVFRCAVNKGKVLTPALQEETLSAVTWYCMSGDRHVYFILKSTIENNLLIDPEI